MRYIPRVLIWIFAGCATACHTPATTDKPIRDSIPAGAPVLDAVTAIAHMQTEPGMEVQLVAAEPLVVAPVAMTFDNRGRMWVVEMTGFMPDTSGNGEDIPNGKIVILEDTDGDGQADNRKVFLDSLVLPRAVCLVGNDVLVAEPPRLWMVENRNDRPGKKILIDSLYAAGGNVEHQPNGLLRAMDNWIYNAKSDRRYRREGTRWLTSLTRFRGQWGISQDNTGRLFYNNNSENLLGDYFLPGMGAAPAVTGQQPASGNSGALTVAGFDEKIVPDTRVFPARANTGVNRGYAKGMLDDSLRLQHFTAACGPLIYRGGLLGTAFEGNAFVAEPSANLIKRDILTDSGYTVQGHPAYTGREFLRSTDERFRPVNLYTGPDGALYVLDMYRGIIQHKTYLTPYLKKEIKARGLSLPLNCGRIYRIVPKGVQVLRKGINENPDSLTAMLDHPNGYLRDLAQQLLVDRQLVQQVPRLQERLRTADSRVTGLLHALWVLEGLHSLTAADVLPLLRHPDVTVRSHALAVLPEVKGLSAILPLLPAMAADPAQAPYIAYLLPAVRRIQPNIAGALQKQLIKSYAHDRYTADALLMDAAGKETALHQQLKALHIDTAAIIYDHLKKRLAHMASRAQQTAVAALADKYPRGYKIFTTVCQTCHGKAGEGIASLAPPLDNSEWVTGNKDLLTRIVLYGLTGPVQVGHKIYQAPEINGDMPGIHANDEYGPEDIAQLLSFIRKAWHNRAGEVSAAEVIQVQQQSQGRQKPFTTAELQQ